MTYLADIVDAHPRAAFLVCGSGTSLTQFPADFYEEWDGVTIGINEAKDYFTPDYHIDVNIANHTITDSLGGKICFEYTSPSASIDTAKSGKLSMRGTGALPAFTAAYQLGAGVIYLIGIDLQAGPDGRIYFEGCTKQPPERYQLADENDPEVQATIRCFADAFDKYRSVGVEVFNLSKNSRLKNIEVVEFAE